MNVKGPGQPPTPGVTDAEAQSNPANLTKSDRPGDIEKSAGSPGRAEAGKAFAEKVSATRPAEVAGVVSGTRPSDVVVGDLAADLRSGKLTSRAAVDKILDRVVARQVGPEAPAAVRDRVRAALQDALDDDPLLADKLRQLD